LKETGLVRKIGVSVYNARQIDAIFSRYPLDLIQVPLNVFDQRLLHSGHLKKLKQQGLEIHARSPFLQGVLLASPEELPTHFRIITNHLQQYRRWLAANRLSPAQAALGFVNQLPEIDAVIVGVETEKQFCQNLQDVRTPWPMCDMRQFAIDDEAIIDPRLWHFNTSGREEAP
jgi:aryl-alcohol dehydrogenase-like predicted oxidoreductase